MDYFERKDFEEQVVVDHIDGVVAEDLLVQHFGFNPTKEDQLSLVPTSVI